MKDDNKELIMLAIEGDKVGGYVIQGNRPWHDILMDWLKIAMDTKNRVYDCSIEQE